MTILAAFPRDKLGPWFRMELLADSIVCARTECALEHFKSQTSEHYSVKKRESDKQIIERAIGLLGEIEKAQLIVIGNRMSEFTERGIYLRGATYRTIQIVTQEEKPKILEYISELEGILKRVKSDSIDPQNPKIEGATQFFKTAIGIYRNWNTPV